MIQFIVVSSFFLQDYISFIFSLVFFFVVFFFGVLVFNLHHFPFQWTVERLLVSKLKENEKIIIKKEKENMNKEKLFPCSFPLIMSVSVS